MEGDGKAVVYAGGWSDYRAQRGGDWTDDNEEKHSKSVASGVKVKQEVKPAKGLSFTQKHRLEALPGVMERLEAEIAKLEDFMAAPDLFSKEPVKFRKGSEALAERQRALEKAEAEWLMLEEKASEAG
jgi:ATP-binding cassette subfamily F protein uup